MLVSEFLTNLKRRGQIQAAQTVLTDADFIGFANDEMKTVICPKILSLRDNYFRAQQDYALTGKRRYRLPQRVLGGRISSVVIIDGSGSQYDLPQLSNNSKPDNGITGYFMSQGQIIIVGTVPTGTMRVFFPLRPPKMSSTAVSTGWVVTAVPGISATSVTITDTLQGITRRQVIRSRSPYRTVSIVLTSGSNCVGFSSDVDMFALDDIVIADDSTHIVPLQEQLCDWLLQRTYMRVLESLGHTNQLQTAGAKLADMQKDIMAMMTPRVQNAPKTIVGGQIMGWIQS